METHWNINEPAELTKRKQARNYCFTLNNYTSEELESIALNKFRYLVYGKEVGESGTPHLQGYLEVAKPMTFMAIKAECPGLVRASFHRRRGTREQAKNYCLKGEQSHEEWDELHETGPNWGANAQITEYGSWKAGGQGARNDWNTILEDIENASSLYAFAKEQPEIAIKYTTGVQRIMEAKKDEENNIRLQKEFSAFKPNNWQHKLLEELKGTPNNRSVIWYVDPEGGKGKTYMAKYLKANMEAAYLTNCKSADAAHAYKGESIVIFDYSRSNDGTINYSILEQIKNGMIFSPKYDSRTKVYATPHVVCLANFYPNKSMLSMDRWDIRILDKKSAEYPELTNESEAAINMETDIVDELINALNEQELTSAPCDDRVDEKTATYSAEFERCIDTGDVARLSSWHDLHGCNPLEEEAGNTEAASSPIDYYEEYYKEHDLFYEEYCPCCDSIIYH